MHFPAIPNSRNIQYFVENRRPIQQKNLFAMELVLNMKLRILAIKL